MAQVRHLLLLLCVAYSVDLIASQSGIKKVVICEHKQRNIRCGGGETIQIVSAKYGRSNRNTCPGAVKTTSCYAKRSREIVQRTCSKKRSCRLQAKNKVFGDPCKGTYKYLQVRYRCKKKNPAGGIKRIVTCEHKEMKIRCGAGKVIKIISAKYGRSNRNTCPGAVKTTSCRANTSRKVVNKACNSKRSCQVKAKNSVFGDPCKGTFKYLEVRYQCRKKNPSVGIKRSVTCEHKEMKIKCGTGKVIKIISAKYGRSNRNTCPGAVKTTSCRANTSRKVVNKACNNKRSCKVKAKNSVFGDPCRGTFKYLEVRYQCRKKNPSVGIKRSVTCEHKEMKIKCGAGKVIKIISAKYGRSNRNTCPGAVKTTSCRANTSRKVVNKACNNKRSCKVKAKNSVFGDPCRGTFKYLEVRYQCRKKKPSVGIKRSVTCEHKEMKIKCGTGKVIKVISAKYGRSNRNTCPGAVKTTSCRANTSRKVVNKACSNKRSCKVKAKNSVFGDPCRGTFKYLEVRYQCRKKNPPRDAGCTRKRKVLCPRGRTNNRNKNKMKRCRVWGASRSLSVRRLSRNPNCIKNKDFYLRGNRLFVKQKCRGRYEVTYKKRGGCDSRDCSKTGSCRCKPGYLWNADTGCYRPCQCTASGDPHFVTYGKNKIHFMGVCTYILSESVDVNNKCAFSVYVKNERRGRNTKVSYVRNVYVKISKAEMWLRKGGIVYLLEKNGMKRMSSFPLALNYAGVEVTKSGKYLIVNALNCGIMVKFDGRSVVTVSIPRSFEGKTTGLCGNCGKPELDFTTSDGKQVAANKEGYAAIGDSYNVPNMADDDDENCKTTPFAGCKDASVVNSILSNNALCGYMKNSNSPFAKCFDKVDPKELDIYREDCASDVCSTPDNQQESVCDSLDMLAEFCRKAGVPVSFRTETFCRPQCEGKNMIYDYEMSGCPATCSDPNAPESCTESKSEGCRCKNGYLLSGDKCVPMSECGCTIENDEGEEEYFELGQTRVLDDCSTVEICRKGAYGGEPNMVRDEKLRRRKCGRNAVCTYVGDDRKCVCKNGYVDMGNRGCIAPQRNCIKVTKKKVCKAGNRRTKICKFTVRNGRFLNVIVASKNGKCNDMTFTPIGRRRIRVARGCKVTYSIVYIKRGACRNLCSGNREWRNGRCRCKAGLVKGRNGRCIGVTLSVKTSTICEHKSKRISCKAGKVLYIRRAVYGRNNRNTCPHSSIKTTKCAANTSLRKVRQKCNGKRSCKLEAKNSVFGDPCRGTFKYLRVQYQCKPEGKKVVICEHKSRRISCKAGKVLYIRRAVYGRNNRNTCPHSSIKTTNCASKTSLRKVRQKCNGKRSCKLEAKNSVFGDPCRGTFKYLRVQYQCKPEGKKVVICEHKSRRISCKSGKVLYIRRAVYGRNNRNTCPHSSIKTTNCASKTSLRKVRQKCNGKRSCKLEAKNSVFGDPCRGTFKFLRVQYQCKPRGQQNQQPACTKKKDIVCPPRNGKSRKPNRKYWCRVRGATKVMSMELRSQLRNKQCKEGVDYYTRGKRIVVKGKCQGRYGVIIRPRGGCKGKCGENAIPRRNGRGCRCKSGTEGDPYSVCKGMCECRASGDPHYKTFGGKKIDFMGICRYVLSESDGDKCKYSVEAKNERRGNNKRVSYVKDVFVTIGKADIALKKGREVYINTEEGYELVTDFPRSIDGDVEIEQSGRFVVVSSSSCGIKVRFDGRSVVAIAVPFTFKGKTSGLCGNCGKPELDYTTSDGVDVSGKKDRNELIGNSYLSEEQEEGDNCKITAIPFEGCKDASKEKSIIENKQMCGLIQRSNSPFAACLQKTTDESLRDLQKACAGDVCATPENPRESVCLSLDNLAKYCSDEHQINVAYRTNTFCPMKCPKNMVFDNDVSGCPKTCSDPNPSDCDEPSSEGCTCPPTYLLSGNKCVKETDCGCTEVNDNGDQKYYELGDKMVMDDCSTVKVCRKDNSGKAKMIIDESLRRTACHADAKCVYRGKYPKCICNRGFIDAGNNQCIAPSPSCVKTTRQRICKSRGRRTRRCRIRIRKARIIGMKIQTLNNNCKKQDAYEIRNRRIVVRRGCHLGYRISYVRNRDLVKCRCPIGSKLNRATGKCEGIKRVVTCEHKEMEIKCGAGKVIKIISAKYGRSNRNTCPGAVKTTSCRANTSRKVVNKACNNKRRCKVKAKNSVFGDPCRGTFKYLEVRYQCRKKKPSVGIKRVVTCEHKEMKIKCGAGKVIKIISAKYGRSNRNTCPGAVKTTSCRANTSRKVVNKACSNKRSCKVKAKNSVFGDPCRGTFKYLEVRYQCRKKPSVGIKRSVTCEHKEMKIKCGAGKVIKIISAKYGRSNRNTCPGAVKTTSCRANTSRKVVNKACNYKRSCKVKAKNSVFGDPCRGTFKYLEVRYQCRKKPSVGIKRVVTCEHKEMKIKCGAGKVIKIISAKYGRSNRNTCPGAVKTTSCRANTSRKVVNKACNKRRSCKVKAKNSVFGDPCRGTFKYLEVRYQCRRKNPPRGVGCTRKRKVLCPRGRTNNRNKNKMKRCRVWGASRSLSVRRLSRNPNCIKNKDFYLRGNRLFVKQKCRGRYEVTYKKRGGCDSRDCSKTGSCRCKPGYLWNADSGCYRPCQCTASGDPHFVTFGKNKIHFMGVCTYILSESVDVNNKCAFSVYVKNERRGRNTKVSYVRNVYVKISNAEMWLRKGGTVHLLEKNGMKRVSSFPLALNYAGVEVTKSGKYLIVNALNCGIMVKFDGRSVVTMSIPRSFEGKTTGLCGNCGKPELDFTTSDGKPVAANKEGYAAIGDSYNVPNMADDDDENCKTTPFAGCKDASVVNSILSNNKLCGYMKNSNSPFSKCFDKVDPKELDIYREDCASDVCSTPDNQQESVCDSLDMLAEFCRKAGVPVSFRTETFCSPQCEGKNMIYDYEMSGCPATCSDPNAPESCTESKSEGCRCKNGYLLSGDKCVPMSECGCTIENNEGEEEYFELGQTRVLDDCSTVEICRKGANGEEPKMVRDEKLRRRKCDRNAVCTYVGDDRKCVCKSGYVNMGIRGCIAPQRNCIKVTEKKVCKAGNRRTKICRFRVRNGRFLNVIVSSKNDKCNDMTFTPIGRRRIRVARGCKVTYSIVYIKRGACRNLCSGNREWRNGRCRCKAGLRKGINGRCIGVTLSVKKLTICEHKSKRISCKAGKVLYINRAIYGRNNRNTCPHSSIKTTKCAAKTSLRKVRQQCNGKRSCKLEAKNSVFGDPCRGTFKFLRVQYQCRPEGKKVVICEHKSRRISCKAGKVLYIRRAVYGRNNRNTCPHSSIKTTKCAAKASLRKVRQQCNGKRSCKLDAKNSVFGDPCRGTFKYLRVQYQCRPEGKKVVICEHKSRRISCKAGKVLYIRRAVYGRNNRNTCPHSSIKTTNCAAKTSLRKVRQKCNGRRSCKLEAKNSVFGDPCRGTFKYLRVQYQCKPGGQQNQQPACTKKKDIVCPPRNGKSRKPNRKYWCRVRGATKVMSMELRSQLRNKQCKEGVDYYTRGKRIVVKGKCQGRYGVIIRPRGGCKGKCGENAIPRRYGRGCRCKPGTEGDPYSVCKGMCECRASGDPHYKTFGGKKIDFMGICRYVLSESDGDKCKYSVEAKNERRGNNKRVSYVKDVFVSIGKVDIALKKGQQVYINTEEGYELVTDFPRSIDGDVEIEQSGRFVVVSSASCGIKVRFDGRSVVAIAVPFTFKGKTSGLCGNCGKPELDYTTSDGVDVSDKKDRNELIGNSYLSEEQEEGDNSCKITAIPFEGCKDASKEKSIIEDKQMCGLIQRSNSPFAACLQKTSDESLRDLQKACAGDVCATPENPRESVCLSLDNLAKYCSDEHQINVAYRTNTFCPMKCPKNMVFDNDVSGCPKTCSDPNPSDCDEPSSEGCTCPPNYLLSGNKCVKETDCGCTEVNDNGDQKYYELGDKMVMDDCSTVKVCRKDNSGKAKMIIDESLRRPACHADAKCVFRGKYPKCVCNRGFIDAGNNQCIAPSPACVKTTRRRICKSRGRRTRRCRIRIRKATIIGMKIETLNYKCKKQDAYEIRNRRIAVRRGCHLGYTIIYVRNKDLLKCRCPIGSKLNRATGKCEEPACVSEEIRCESTAGNRKSLCKIKGRGRITKIKLQEGFPRAECIRDTYRRRGTYGFSGKYVWVRNKCKGEFKVCLEEGSGCVPECKNNARCVDGECKCEKGMIGNPKIGCFNICLCKAYGDVHFRQYDGQRIDFQGICKYTLTEHVRKSDKCYFHVKEQSERRGKNQRVSFMRYMEVEIHGHTFKLDQKHAVLVDGRSVRMPHFGRNYAIYRYGDYTVLDSSCKIRIVWNGRSNGFVAIAKEYGESVRGLCGNCNGDKSDDYIDKYNNNLKQNKKDRDVLYGDSFIVHDGEQNKPQCKSTPKPKTCRGATLRFVKTVWCRNAYRINRRSPFYACLKKSPPLAAEAYGSCIYDGCATPRRKIKQVVCDDYEQLAADCAVIGVPVRRWRRKVGCTRPCPNRRTMRYVDVLPVLQPNCAVDDEIPSQTGVGLEIGGCVCKKGYVQSGNQCVKKKNCGCMVNGAYILVNEIWEDCYGKYKCVRKTGGTEIAVLRSKSPCPANTDCFYDGGKYACRVAQIPSEPECNVKINGIVIGKTIPIGAQYSDCRGEYKCKQVGNSGVLENTGRPCDASAECVKEGSDYVCKCLDGYIGNGRTCTPKEPTVPPVVKEPECEENINGIVSGKKIPIGAQYSDCLGQHKCVKVGNSAVLQNTGRPCDASAECVKEGSNYVCKCYDGYIGDGRICTPEEPKGLPEEPECEENINGIVSGKKLPIGAQYSDCLGDHKCVKVGNSAVLQNTGRPCDVFAQCVKEGSDHVCKCKDGYTGDGRTCTQLKCDVKINGIANGHKIPIGMEYEDCQGKYKCTKSGDSAALITITNFGPCHESAKCVKEGSKYVCKCSEGYDGDGRECEEVRTLGPPVMAAPAPSCSGCINVYDVMNDLTVSDIVMDDAYLNLDMNKVKILPSNPAPFADVSNIVTITINPARRINCLHFANGNTNILSYNIMASFGQNMVINQNVNNPASSFTFNGNPLIDKITLTFTPVNVQERVRIKPQILECRDPVGCTPECTDQATCKEVNGNFQCVCEVPGYELDGVRCIDINECSRNTDDCKYPATCKNTDGSFKCVCERTGYEEVGNQCVDINECLTNKHDCVSPAECRNTEGSFKCVCLDGGYELQGDECVDINECVRGTHQCISPAKCKNTIGAYICECNIPGFELHGRGCRDINECTRGSHNCIKPAECVNTQGSFKCKCSVPGFELDKVKCVDINECRNGKHNCKPPLTCKNRIGSFYCECGKGAKEVGGKCIDINECKLKIDKCDEKADCINTEGSYTCKCKPGYIGSGRRCRDENECRRRGSRRVCKGPFRCKNTIGSYKCVCRTGYKRVGNKCKKLCNNVLCHKFAVCARQGRYGGRTCKCKRGYLGNGLQCGKKCGPDFGCDENALCRGPRWRRACACKQGFIGTGLRCAEKCTCSVTGNSRVMLFDTSVLRINNAECKYLISEYTSSEEDKKRCNYKIYIYTGKNPRSGLSVTRSVELHIYGMTVSLLSGGEVRVNGLKIVLPYHSRNNELVVEWSGMYVRVRTKCYLFLHWRNHNLYIDAAKFYSSGMTGLCGNCNGKPDDFVTSGGDDVSSFADKENRIVDSYANPIYINNMLQECKTTEFVNKCNRRLTRPSRRNCARLHPKARRTPFKRCMAAYPLLAKQLYQSCLTDFCANVGHTANLNDIVCRLEEAMYMRCRLLGHSVRWRPRRCPIKCPRFTRYYPLASPNYPTCLDPTAHRVAFDARIEGCYCKGRRLLSGNKCVLPRDCGCSKNGFYYPVGFGWLNEFCDGRITCKKNPKARRKLKLARGVMKTVILDNDSSRCHEKATCDVHDGIRQCGCRPGFIGNGHTVCKPQYSCDFAQNTTDCTSTVQLNGDCQYISQYDQCKFTVITVVYNGKQEAHITFHYALDHEKVILGPGQSNNDHCAKFDFDNDSKILIIKEPVCSCPPEKP